MNRTFKSVRKIYWKQAKYRITWYIFNFDNLQIVLYNISPVCIKGSAYAKIQFDKHLDMTILRFTALSYLSDKG